MKYSDVVVLIRKAPDGTISRTNAIVLGSAVQPPDGKALKGRANTYLAPGEYLDLAFPRPLITDQLLKTRSFNDIFVPAWEVPRWKDGASIGWDPGSATAVAPVPPPPQPTLTPDAGDMKAQATRAKK